VQTISATPMPCEIPRKLVCLAVDHRRVISGTLRQSQSGRYFATVSVTSTRIVSPLIGSAAVVNWVV
jgi:hypothetical protein